MEMKGYIDTLRRGENLTPAAVEDLMRRIMSGTEAQGEVAEVLLALRAKGPSVEEITGAARLLRQFSVPISTRHARVLDTCGTGGDKKGTFNISTAAALVAAAAGAVVAKHGNRSVSSRCGSACVLEALGVNIQASPSTLQRCLDEEGITFLFAQRLHPAMKNVAAVRKALGVETIFNLLGPLMNPARATHQVMGVYRRDLVAPMAQVLRALGLQRALVVHGSDGLDELTTCGPTWAGEFDGSQVSTYEIDPQALGLSLARPDDLQGTDAEGNARLIRAILDGEKGPQRDIVLLNAGAALYVFGLAADLKAGLACAAAAVDDGRAAAKLEALRRLTHEDGEG